MDLEKLQRNWNDLGAADPMWAILTNPARRGGKWDTEAFFATGEKWISEYDAILDELGTHPARHDRALDFGCGAGRLTRALGSRYRAVDGVDVAATMIDLARSSNADHDNLTFHLNEKADLSLFDDGSFDFVVSIVVLQHMSNDLKTGYLHEFVRVLRPGGMAMFTIPSNPKATLRGLVRRMPNSVQNLYRRRAYGHHAVMEFHPFKRAKVEDVLRSTGASIVAVRPEATAGPDFDSYLYVVQKPSA